ncbi:unnamed protein product [Zymoseptoria tritici ST99CH_1E4]|uniref:Core Histone H2A/H2B/H3 domain-containing protein n=1 Tax=Zymoseptoria tritici ST99CH_1E4 TaxID=1276532 RepID=A0A2H1GTJ1_ZYMTR|nr:unnamed protein product [Zymoseptoria tritici ST99CH_1E4]
MASRVFLVKRPDNGIYRKRAVRFKAGKLTKGPRNSPNGLVLAETPFRRLALEISKTIEPNVRLDRNASKTLQDAAEGFLIARFEQANLVAAQYGRICIQEQDLQIADLVQSKKKT